MDVWLKDTSFLLASLDCFTMEFCKIFRRPNYKTYWYLRNHTRLWADCLQRSHEQENRQNRQIWIKQPTFIDSLWQAQPKVEVLKFIFFRFERRPPRRTQTLGPHSFKVAQNQQILLSKCLDYHSRISEVVPNEKLSETPALAASPFIDSLRFDHPLIPLALLFLWVDQPYFNLRFSLFLNLGPLVF